MIFFRVQNYLKHYIAALGEHKQTDDKLTAGTGYIYQGYPEHEVYTPLSVFKIKTSWKYLNVDYSQKVSGKSIYKFLGARITDRRHIYICIYICR